MTMASKGSSKISVNGEEALSALRKVNAAKDSPGIPAPSSLVMQAPPSYAATSYFNSGVSSYTEGLKRAVDSLRLQLSTLHDDIKQTVDEFAARDASVADEAAAMSSSIDSGSIGSGPAAPSSAVPPVNTSGW
jgi:hypothetical protein